MGSIKAYFVGPVQGTSASEEEFLPLLYGHRQHFLQKGNMQTEAQ